MKKLIFLLGVIFVLFISSCVDEEEPVLKSGGSYSCEVSSCNSGIKVLNVESSSNSHAGLPTSEDYDLYVCCDSSNTGDFTVDSTVPFYPVFSLSDNTNAHVGDEDDYSNIIGFDGVSCDIKTNCDEVEFCVFELENGLGNYINAHVASCGSGYDWSTCCTYGNVEVIEGCTDPNAHNYDPDATLDDGSCLTCNDYALNGDETGIDCGGSLCPPCDTSCGIINSYWSVFNLESGQWETVEGGETKNVNNNQPVWIIVEGNAYCSGESVDLSLINLEEMNDEDPSGSPPQFSGETQDGEVVIGDFPSSLIFGEDNVALSPWYVSGCDQFLEWPEYKFIASYSEQAVHSGILDVQCDIDSDTCGDGYYDSNLEACDLSSGSNQCSAGEDCVGCSCLNSADVDCQTEFGSDYLCLNPSECDGTFTNAGQIGDCNLESYVCGICEPDDGVDCEVDECGNPEDDLYCPETQDPADSGYYWACVEDSDGCGVCDQFPETTGGGGGNCQTVHIVEGACQPCQEGDICELGGILTQEWYTYYWTDEFCSDVDEDDVNAEECLSNLGTPYPEILDYCEGFTSQTADCYFSLEEDVPFFDWFSLVFALMILISYYASNRKQKVL